MLAAVGDELVVLVQGPVGHAAVEVVGAETLLKSQVYYLLLWASTSVKCTIWYGKYGMHTLMPHPTKAPVFLQ